MTTAGARISAPQLRWNRFASAKQNMEATSMAIEKTGGAVRKYLTRVLAAGALLAIYAVGTLSVSGLFLASTTEVASARNGRGRGRGGGWVAVAVAAGV